MPNYILYDPTSSPVANRVKQYLKSFDGGREGELSSFVKDPDLTGVDLNDRMLVDAGAVRNLTAQEKQTEDDANAAALLVAIKQAAKDIFINPTTPDRHAIRLGFETVMEMVVSEINILRGQHALADRTDTQLKNAFKATFESKIDAL